MPRIKLNQKGFSVVEGLLAVVILLIVVFVGYYVYHAQSKTTETYNASTEVSNSPTVAAKAKKAAATPPAAASQQYFTIKEWGVEATQPSGVTLTYSMDSNNKNMANFTSTELLAKDTTCTEGYGGSIQRLAPNEDASEGSTGGMTAAQTAGSMDKSKYAFIGGYYYFFHHAQSDCPGDTSSDPNKSLEFTLLTQTNNAVQGLVSGLQAE